MDALLVRMAVVVCWELCSVSAVAFLRYLKDISVVCRAEIVVSVQVKISARAVSVERVHHRHACAHTPVALLISHAPCLLIVVLMPAALASSFSPVIAPRFHRPTRPASVLPSMRRILRREQT